MANSYLNGTLRSTAATKRFQIATLVNDLSRTVALLTAAIDREEQRGVSDLADPAYPVLARNLRARRENLEATIAELEAMIQ